jgi:hypothetical protein
MADIGRPTVMTELVVAKLEEAFINGASDVEACFFAGIHKQSLYDYQKLNPDFADRKEALKDQTKFQAKKNVKAKIDEKDIETSKWYLERKAKDEFSSKSDHALTDGEGKPLNMIPQVAIIDFDTYLKSKNAESTGT